MIDSTVVFSAKKGINLPPEKRRLSMVFQSYAIWPHLSVFENVAYGLRIQKLRGNDLQKRVHEALQMVGMLEFANRPATDLSGGQQQRVALARSYAVRSKAILLDEPLSNLDARLRARMRDELKELQRQFEVSTIYVTHDQEEAMAISDRIIVMRDGRIEQIGTPLEIYDTPRTQFVADFIGAANILTARRVKDLGAGRILLRVGQAELEAYGGPADRAAGIDKTQLVAVRTVYPKIRREGFEATANVWPAVIARRVLLGDLVSYVVRWPGGDLRVNEFPTSVFEEGERVHLYIPPRRAIIVAS